MASKHLIQSLAENLAQYFSNINKQDYKVKFRKLKMNVLLKSFLIFGLFLKSCICNYPSTEILGFEITWNPMINKIEFNVSARLENGVDPNDAWIGIGINTSPRMVSFF